MCMEMHIDGVFGRHAKPSEAAQSDDIHLEKRRESQSWSDPSKYHLHLEGFTFPPPSFPF